VLDAIETDVHLSPEIHGPQFGFVAAPHEVVGLSTLNLRCRDSLSVAHFLYESLFLGFPILDG